MRLRDLPALSPRPLPHIGLGTMSFCAPREDGDPMPWDEAVDLLHHGFSLGLTLVDTADIYAPDAERFGYAERLVGDAARRFGRREELCLVTKIGITREPSPDGERWGRNGTAAYLRAAAERSAERLGTVPDALLLHRVDREGDRFEESVGALLAIRDAGLARRIGIGNVSRAECERAWQLTEGTLVAVENERSPRYRGDADVVDWCDEHGVAYLAWSPFGGPDDSARLAVKYPDFAAVAGELAASLGRSVSAHQVALAWLGARPTVIPLPAFSRKSTLEASAAAGELTLSPAQLTRLDASPAGEGSLYPD